MLLLGGNLATLTTFAPFKLAAVGHGDRRNDDPQGGGQNEVVGQEGYPRYRQGIKDSHAGREARVHEHRHEQAPGPVVDPYHEHPVGWQEGEEHHGQVDGHRTVIGDRPRFSDFSLERCKKTVVCPYYSLITTPSTKL